MKEIETIADLATCMDSSLLEKQKKAYEEVIEKYCNINPLYAAIEKSMKTDVDFAMFMSLIIARSTLTARINELEGKTND